MIILIDRAELRERVNRLYEVATLEQKKILLDVIEMIETAPAIRSVEDGKCQN